MIKLLDLFCGAGGCAVGYKQAADDLGVASATTEIVTLIAETKKKATQLMYGLCRFYLCMEQEDLKP